MGCEGASGGCQFIFSDLGGWYMGADYMVLYWVILPTRDTELCLGTSVVVTTEGAPGIKWVGPGDTT